MPYPCNRCGRVVTPQPSMCCTPCYQQIDEESQIWAEEQMQESDHVLAQWRRQDKASSGGGCALLLLATAALPVVLDQLPTVF